MTRLFSASSNRPENFFPWGDLNSERVQAEDMWHERGVGSAENWTQEEFACEHGTEGASAPSHLHYSQNTGTSFPLLLLTPTGRMGASTKKKLTISRKDLLILTFGNFSTKRLLDHQLMRPIHTYSFLVSTLYLCSNKAQRNLSFLHKKDIWK